MKPMTPQQVRAFEGQYRCKATIIDGEPVILVARPGGDLDAHDLELIDAYALAMAANVQERMGCDLEVTVYTPEGCKNAVGIVVKPTNSSMN
jgi:hypothetical protein